MRRKKWINTGYIGIVMGFLYVPIVVMAVFSFNESKSRALWTGFTLGWYEKLFTNEAILASLGNTLLIAIVSTVIATVLGTLAAIGINAMGRWAKSLVLNITYMPIINPEIVTGVSLMLLFVFVRDRFGVPLEMGFLTLILAHITFSVPYVILNVIPKLRQLDHHIYDAALDLGCNPLEAFLKVVIPEILPGVISGFLMAFTFSLDDFIISYFVSGPTFSTLPITIYAMTRRKVSPEINALSTVVFLFVLGILTLSNYLQAKREARSKTAY